LYGYPRPREAALNLAAAGGCHVLEGIHADTSRPNVRFSFSRYNTKDEIDFAVSILKEAFEKELVD